MVLENPVARISMTAVAAILCLSCLCLGCKDNRLDIVRDTEQQIVALKTKSDALRDAAGYLSQMTPLNRENVAREVQLHLNKWLLTASNSTPDSIPSELVDGVPPDLRAEALLENGATASFDLWDIEYVYQCKLFRRLSSWIIERPLRDSLVRPWVDAQSTKMSPEDFSKLEQACKLFDWSVRNIVLQGNATEVESLSDDPRKPLVDPGLGYGYLPWQTVLYGRGDFMERGRVFTALAQQRDLQTVWIALRLPSSPSAKIWTVGVLLSGHCFLFEPKLGLPILHPDTFAVATLADVQKEERILRRLDVPGRFDYAVNPGDTSKVDILVEADPSALTKRIALLQSSLTGDDRVLLQPNFHALSDQIKKTIPEAPIALWQLPFLARVYAIDIRHRMEMNTPFTAQYMIEHAVWFINTPSSTARVKHLGGEFDNTFDTTGALSTYMDCRLPDETIDRLPDDPDVQKELQIPREATESMEQFQYRLMQLQVVFRQSKVDASFLLGQLHFDLGNYSEVDGWLKKRTLSNQQAVRWHSAARYTLARALQEQGKLADAIAELSEDSSPMEAGNRLRVRYLSK